MKTRPKTLLGISDGRRHDFQPKKIEIENKTKYRSPLYIHTHLKSVEGREMLIVVVHCIEERIDQDCNNIKTIVIEKIIIGTYLRLFSFDDRSCKFLRSDKAPP